MKPLITTIVEKATKKGGYYSIECEGEEYQELTNDMSLLCNQKATDKYVGIDNLDECRIELYDKDKEYRGYFYWIAYNRGSDRVADYSTSLESFIKIDKVFEKWEDEYYRL